MASFSKKKAAEEAFRILCTPFRSFGDNNLPVIFLQAKAAKFILHGKKIRGYRWQRAKENSGQKRILIIHGFSSTSYKFEKYIISFINKGYEVLAFDAPAHGRSQGSTLNVLGYRDMVAKVIARYGPIDHFIAHSLGGLALCLALEDIEHDENQKIVLIAPTTETSTIINNTLNLLNINDKETKSEIAGLIFQQSHQHIEWFSIRRALKRIKAKILWVHDEDDKVTPISDIKGIQQKNLPNVEFYITKGLGHNKIYHDEAVKERVINFL